MKTMFHLCFTAKQQSFHSKQELPLTKHQLGVPPEAFTRETLYFIVCVSISIPYTPTPSRLYPVL